MEKSYVHSVLLRGGSKVIKFMIFQTVVICLVMWIFGLDGIGWALLIAFISCVLFAPIFFKNK